MRPLELLDGLGLEMVHWMWVPQTPEGVIADETLHDRSRTLSRREQIVLLDLLLRREHNIWIARKR